MELASLAALSIVSALSGAFIIEVIKDDPGRSHKLPSVITKRIRQINKQEIERLAKELTRSKKRTRI